MYVPAVGKCSFHRLWVRSSSFFSLASSNLAMFAQTVGFSWSCARSTASLLRQAARPSSVGAVLAPWRRCFDKLHALSTFSQVLRLRTLFHVLRVDWSPSSIHIPSSARCACRGCISRARLLWVVTAELSRLSALSAPLCVSLQRRTRGLPVWHLRHHCAVVGSR